ncbi:YolD-like family protein [Bacillus sp. ISL-7]|uniref:YolD-like family protein n=1 Tax=Bacillus sp. ISL-7 TaxID=2819136 RepID=UPI001BE710FB|nr:YolD-like family protein [Bacillus sp. ISL-7]MBT2734737.1 YolD-like family protein [Bacillus sp. ISL-7]
MIRDRGTKKWTASFMMPEHIRELKKMMNEANKQPRPILDEMEIEEMERLLQKSLMQGTLLQVTTWKGGFFNKKVCQVVQIDLVAKTIAFQDKLQSKFKTPFFNITSVTEVNSY